MTSGGSDTTPTSVRRSIADPHAPARERLADAVVRTPGALSWDLRVAARDGATVPAPFAAFVEKVRERPHTVTDGDIEAMQVAGCSDEEIFEITVATAVGEGLRRIAAGLGALEEKADGGERA